jgi:hypothetical protein
MERGGGDVWWPHPSLMEDGEIYNLIIPPLDICYLNVLSDTQLAISMSVYKIVKEQGR